jgi:uncharacterized protein (TIGR00251 family)
MSPAFIKQTAAGTLLFVKLQPRASRQQVNGVQGQELRVSVTAPPVDAAANRALVEYLAGLCGVSRSAIELVRGQTSRHKTILVKGLAPAAVLEKLVPYL